MKIKVNQVLKDLKGEDLKGKKKGEKVELKTICVNALLSEVPEKEGAKIDGNEKMKRFILAEKIQKANEIELTVEESSKIKAIIGGAFPPLVVGRAYNALEGKN